MTYCEDYPCCGHTPSDPCAAQEYDAPGYYDTTIRGNEHALCDHEYGECDVWDEDEPEDDDADDSDYFMEDQWLDGSYED